MATIFLRRYSGKRPVRILLDEGDLERVSAYKWWRNSIGYIVGRIEGKEVSLHRFILGFPQGETVDHINGDKLDNRRCNLRVCSIKENVRNSKLSKNNKSGYSGVSYRPSGRKWRAYIMVDRKQIYLGSYDNKEDAVAARRKAELQYFGEFAPSATRERD